MQVLRSARPTPSVRRLVRVNDYEVTGIFIPAADGPNGPLSKADAPSGDWAGAVRIGPTEVRVVLADIEGHGVGARVYHEYLEAKLTAAREGPQSLWLSEVHNGWPGERFATLAVVDVDTAAHEVKLLSAGHPSPVMKMNAGRVKAWNLPTVGAIGIPELPPIQMLPASIAEFPLGSCIILVSDGVLDASNAHGATFGVHGLLGILPGLVTGPCAACQIARTVLRHLGSNPVTDDVSVVVVSRVESTFAPPVRHRRDRCRLPPDDVSRVGIRNFSFA